MGCLILQASLKPYESCELLGYQRRLQFSWIDLPVAILEYSWRINPYQYVYHGFHNALFHSQSIWQRLVLSLAGVQGVMRYGEAMIYGYIQRFE